jgi:23S rRNA G2069 N7-methylase RlmK/C1962 C5-methylase RlmI
MLEIAKKEFEVNTPDLLCMDAKNAVSKLSKENKKYDLILIDCY